MANLFYNVPARLKFLKSVAERIKLKGFEVTTALDGGQALEVARKSQVDVAVVDQKMPDMEGLQVIEKLREQHPAIKTILLTGHGALALLAMSTLKLR